MPGFSRPLSPWEPRRRRLPLRVALILAALTVLAGGAALLADAAGVLQAEEPAVVIAPASESSIALEDAPAPPPTRASTVPTATPHLQQALPEPPATEAAALAASPSLQLHPAEAGNGETVLLSLEATPGLRGTVEVFGRSYPLLREGDVLWTVIGVSLETRPGSYALLVRLYDQAGAEVARAERAFAVVALARPVDHLVLTPSQASVLTPDASRIERELRVEQFVVFDRPRRWDGTWIAPTEGRVTTEFGEGRSINGGPVTNRHSGLDIANIQGTPIVAPAPGRVAWVGEMPIRGRSVLIDHGAGVVSGYHHMVEWRVEAGDLVEPGDLIGLMGSTGLSTGPHLHWELSIYGVNVDPLTWTQVDFRP